MRLELVLLGLSFLCWTFSFLIVTIDPDLRAGFGIGLYGLYVASLFLGWLAGNVYNFRRRRLPHPAGRMLITIYLFGPPSVIFLLWALAPAAVRAAVPLAPVYGYGIFIVFFLVPISFRRAGRRRDEPDG